MIKNLFGLLSFVVVAGCSGDHSIAPPASGPPSPPAVAAAAIPRLSAGPHLGYIVGFDRLSASQRKRADNLQLDAINAGMTLSRIQTDWGDLEPSPGVYNSVDLREQLADAALLGQSVMVTVTAIDTGSFGLPADLLTPDGSQLRSGLTFDDPVIIARFNEFLDWLVPELRKANVWALSLGNEVETNFEGAAIEDAVLAFLTAGADHARGLDPKLAVTVTLTGDGHLNYPNFVSGLLPHLDIYALNYYCLSGGTLQATGPAQWRDDIDRILRAAGDKQIFFQELGCPTGYSDIGAASAPRPDLNSSQALQTEFFSYMLARINNEERLRAATVFQLFDWSPSLAASFSTGLIGTGDPALDIAAARLTEWLATVGMCRWSDGSCRPAWDEFLSALREARQKRKS